mgnify:CR=1 FL=1
MEISTSHPQSAKLNRWVLDKHKAIEEIMKNNVLSPFSWIFKVMKILVFEILESKAASKFPIEIISRSEEKVLKISVPAKIEVNQQTVIPSKEHMIETVLEQLDDQVALQFPSTKASDVLTPSEIRDRINQTIQNQNIQESFTRKTQLLEKFIKRVQEERGIVNKKGKEKEEELQFKDYRTIKMEIPSSNNSNSKPKEVSLLCKPVIQSASLSFHEDFARVADPYSEERQNFETKFKEATATHLGIRPDQVHIIQLSPGSIVIDFKIEVLKKFSKSEETNFYDQIVHQNYLTMIETEMKLTLKKKPTTKVKWNVTCTICSEDFDSIERGILCTGSEPHWCCVECIYQYAKTQFEINRPHFSCIHGCGAQYINTHLVDKITTYVSSKFEQMYTANTFLVYKMQNPDYIECDTCGYLTVPFFGQSVWTCGEDVPEDWVLNDTCCGSEWCLNCKPMRSLTNHNHCITDPVATFRNKVELEISLSFINYCPNFLKDSNLCSNSSMLQKETGCNHMSCPTCQVDFCNLCGKELDVNEIKFEDSDHPCPQFGNEEEVRFFFSFSFLFLFFFSFFPFFKLINSIHFFFHIFNRLIKKGQGEQSNN